MSAVDRIKPDDESATRGLGILAEGPRSLGPKINFRWRYRRPNNGRQSHCSITSASDNREPPLLRICFPFYCLFFRFSILFFIFLFFNFIIISSGLGVSESLGKAALGANLALPRAPLQRGSHGLDPRREFLGAPRVSYGE